MSSDNECDDFSDGMNESEDYSEWDDFENYETQIEENIYAKNGFEPLLWSDVKKSNDGKWYYSTTKNEKLSQRVYDVRRQFKKQLYSHGISLGKNNYSGKWELKFFASTNSKKFVNEKEAQEYRDEKLLMYLKNGTSKKNLF